MRGKGDHSVCALLVGEYEDGRLLIHEVFRESGWRLFEASGRKKALECLNRDPVHVVIASCDMPDWDWKKVLENLRRLARPPQLIVTSRTADEHLWSEVLNCGGYDVLPQPFQRDEIERVIASARRHYDPQPLRSKRHIEPSRFFVA
jgi:DNA-binding response OmpR family regulator